MLMLYVPLGWRMADRAVGSAPKWFNCSFSQPSESFITKSARCSPSSFRNAVSNCCLSRAPSSGIGLIWTVPFDAGQMLVSPLGVGYFQRVVFSQHTRQRCVQGALLLLVGGQYGRNLTA